MVPGTGGALPGGGAEPGSEVLPGAARAAFDVLPIVAEGDVQPEPAGARGPQLLPVALRHPGHPDLRTLVPPGPAPACSGDRDHRRAVFDRRFPRAIRSSSRIPIGFIMKIRRLVRVSWPCRSRYATSGARSRPSGRRRRPGGAPPAGPGPPFQTTATGVRQDETGDLTSRFRSQGGVQRTWIGATLPVRLEQMFADSQGGPPLRARVTRGL
jgi:hypothetical protein